MSACAGENLTNAILRHTLKNKCCIVDIDLQKIIKSAIDDASNPIGTSEIYATVLRTFDLTEVVVVLGSQWGDEGKGKLVSLLSNNAHLCLRFNGGGNAGHTVVQNSSTYALHMVPCGILNGVECLIGSGTVVNFKDLTIELINIAINISKQIVAPPNFSDNNIRNLITRFPPLKILDTNAKIYCFTQLMKLLKISSRAHILFSIHTEIDLAGDQARGHQAIGTTGKGIGPCYSDKCNRTNIRVCDLLLLPEHEQLLREKLCVFASDANKRNFNIEEEIHNLRTYRDIYAESIVDAVLYIKECCSKKLPQYILAEGANGTMLDQDNGTYPYVTSSCTVLGSIYTGGGISPQTRTFIIGVTKAYCTRVGSGPFPSEVFGDVCEKLQNIGREIGTTTGRRRRCGWIDIPQLVYTAHFNGYNALNLTKLDVLDSFDSIGVCVAYSDKYTEKIIPNGYFPAGDHEMKDIKPIITHLKGWRDEMKGKKLNDFKKFEDLPKNAQIFVKFIEGQVKVPIIWIGTGADTEQMICRFHY